MVLLNNRQIRNIKICLWELPVKGKKVNFDASSLFFKFQFCHSQPIYFDIFVSDDAHSKNVKENRNLKPTHFPSDHTRTQVTTAIQTRNCETR